MSKLRAIVAGIAAMGLVTIAAAALVPPAKPISPPHIAEAVPAEFVEIQRRDLTPKRTQNTEYAAPSDLGTRHRIFVGLKPRTYYALAGTEDGGALIVLLHGAGRDGRAMLDMWKNIPRSHGATLIAPNGPRGSWTQEDSIFLITAIEHAQEQYRTDPKRVFLFGHSAGAMAAQLFANRTVGPWTAVATHGGYIGRDALAPVAEGAPVRMYLGSSDALFNPSDARATARRLADYGHDVEYHLIPEHGHWYYDIGPALADETTDWFLQF